MSDATSANGEARWRIERFELIYYNAEYRRWQYFADEAEGSERDAVPANEGVHRRQIRRFLSTLREVVTAAVQLHSQDRFSLETASSDNPKPIRLVHPTFDGWQKHWNAYLDGLLSTAAKEGLDEEVAKELAALRESLRVGGDGKCPLTRRAALSLLSLLPILEDWDTWGCFVRVRDSAADRFSTAPRLPPSRHRTHWFQPFHLAEFTYNGANQISASWKLLGREVTLEAACSDLARRNPTMTFVGKEDFFSYCHYPVQVDSNDEQYLYRCYAHFVDALMTSLSDATTQTPQRYFVIAYPVQVAGRLHFAQIALSTTDTSVSLGLLWDEWEPVHDALWTPECVSAFESELGRISLSAFQFAVTQSLGTNRLEEMTPSRLLEVLAEHIFHTLPIQSLRHEASTWRYVSQFDASLGAIVGQRWKAVADNEAIGARDVGTVVPFDVVSAGLRGSAPLFGGASQVQGPLVRNRAIQTIEQQMVYVSSLKQTLESEESNRKADMRHAEEIARRYVDGLSNEVLADLRAPSATAEVRRRVLDAEVDLASLGCDEPSRCPRRHAGNRARLRVRRFLAQMHDQGDADDGPLFDELKELADPSAVELASILFDSSLVKVATHRCRVEDYFSGDLAAAKAAVTGGDLDGVCQTLQSKLSRAGCGEMAEKLAAAWGAFQIVVCGLTDLARLSNILVDAEGQCIGLLCRLRDEWADARLPLGDPALEPRLSLYTTWNWSLPLFAAYARDVARKFAVMPASADLVAQELGVSTGVGPLRGIHVGNLGVVQHRKILWVPYQIKDSDGFVAEENWPNILKMWTPPLESFATLMVVAPRNEGRHVIRVQATGDGGLPHVLPDTAPRAQFMCAKHEDLSRKHPAHALGSLVFAVRTWAAQETRK